MDPHEIPDQIIQWIVLIALFTSRSKLEEILAMEDPLYGGRKMTDIIKGRWRDDHDDPAKCFTTWTKVIEARERLLSHPPQPSSRLADDIERMWVMPLRSITDAEPTAATAPGSSGPASAEPAAPVSRVPPAEDG